MKTIDYNTQVNDKPMIRKKSQVNVGKILSLISSRYLRNREAKREIKKTIELVRRHR